MSNKGKDKSKKDKKDKKGKGKGKKNKGTAAAAAAGPAPVNRLSFIGLGLLASPIIGFSPLSDALTGNGPFENAIARFVACVAFSVTAAAIIGRLLESAPPPEEGPVETSQGDDSTATSGDIPVPETS